jgi:hypothetical protein
MNKKALLLHPLDNCVVALTDIAAGDLVEYEGEAETATAAIALGHKAAIEDIPPGARR